MRRGIIQRFVEQFGGIGSPSDMVTTGGHGMPCPYEMRRVACRFGALLLFEDAKNKTF